MQPKPTGEPPLHPRPSRPIYAYHATIEEFVPAIAQQGLLAHYNEELGEEVIFVEPDETEAAIYLEPHRGVMLRLRVAGIGHTEDGECVLWDLPSIEPSAIDIRRNDRWIPIVDA